MEQTGKVLEIFNQLPTQQGGLGRNDRSQNSLIQTKAEYEIRLNLLRNL